MTIDRSAWDSQFGTGLRSEYDFTILTAQFTTDARFGDGQQYLLLLSGLDENDEPVEAEMFTVGANWESTDGGITIHTPSNTASINRNSNYGKFCAFAADACEKAGESWIFTADAKDARIWVGTKWKMTEQMVGEAFTNKKSGEKVDARYRLMPTEWLGRDEESVAVSGGIAAAATGVSTPSSAASTQPIAPSPAPVPAEASPPTSAPPVTTPGASVAIATQLAASSADYTAFINAALAVDAIATDDTLVPQLLDSGDTGFYATHHTA